MVIAADWPRMRMRLCVIVDIESTIELGNIRPKPPARIPSVGLNTIPTLRVVIFKCCVGI